MLDHCKTIRRDLPTPPSRIRVVVGGVLVALGGDADRTGRPGSPGPSRRSRRRNSRATCRPAPRQGRRWIPGLPAGPHRRAAGRGTPRRSPPRRARARTAAEPISSGAGADADHRDCPRRAGWPGGPSRRRRPAGARPPPVTAVLGCDRGVVGPGGRPGTRARTRRSPSRPRAPVAPQRPRPRPAPLRSRSLSLACQSGRAVHRSPEDSESPQQRSPTPPRAGLRPSAVAHRDRRRLARQRLLRRGPDSGSAPRPSGRWSSARFCPGGPADPLSWSFVAARSRRWPRSR